MSQNQTNKPSILPARRRAMVLEIIRRTGIASVQDLITQIGASPSTIRRDLEYLEAEGLLNRTHGGAVLLSDFPATFELEPSLNAQVRHDEKTAIGREAARRIKSGDSVIFESSSTVRCAVLAAMGTGLSITAVTNHLEIAHLCGNTENWRTFLLGGALRPNTQIVMGEAAETQLSTIHTDLLLIGAYAITGSTMTDPLPEISALKRRMIAAARRVIMLADGSKFRAPAFAEFCQAGQIAEIITDTTPPPEALDVLRQCGVQVTVVEAEPQPQSV